MPVDDKYPDSTGRRRFVKGVVGSAGLASVGVGTATAVNTMTASTGEGGGSIEYYGVENTGGPAPRAMPQIPVEVDDEGFLKGIWPKPKEVEQQGRTITVAEKDMGGITYSSEWFQYCGVQSYPGIEPDADQDNYFRYVGEPDYDWQAEEVEGGAKVNVEDFSDYEDWGNDIGKSGLGKPAQVTWRSQDLPPGGNVIPVQIIRSTNVEEMSGQNEWINASTAQGFIANLNKCTHFCCVPGFKSTEQSAQFNAQNDIYCPCHQSVYDPFSIVRKSFVSLPRPGE